MSNTTVSILIQSNGTSDKQKGKPQKPPKENNNKNPNSHVGNVKELIIGLYNEFILTYHLLVQNACVSHRLLLINKFFPKKS